MLVKELVELFRTERHDFLNHMQVLLSLIQLGKYERAQEYIFEVSDSIKKESAFLRELPPALGLWLINKIYKGRENDITVSVELDSLVDASSLPFENVHMLEEKWQSACSALSETAGSRYIRIKIAGAENCLRISFEHYSQ